MKIIEFLTFITAGAVMFSSCSSLTGDDEGTDGPGTPGATGLELQVSDMVIQADGKDAAVFTVLSDGKPVSEGVRFYDGATNRQIELPEMAFTTTETGTYTFWAAYGTSHTETVSVTAIGFPVPELPDDPDPENTSFSRRVLLTQFTGTGCGYCPACGQACALFPSFHQGTGSSALFPQIQAVSALCPKAAAGLSFSKARRAAF